MTLTNPSLTYNESFEGDSSDEDEDEEITLRPGAGTALDGTEAGQVDSASEAQRGSLACERLLAHFSRKAGDRGSITDFFCQLSGPDQGRRDCSGDAYFQAKVGFE